MSTNDRSFVEIGASNTSPLTNTARKEIAAEVYVGKNGYVQNAGFTFQPVAALENGNITGPRAIVLHRTDGASVESALNSAKSGVGVHFYIAKDGTVYQAASLLKKTAHVGKIRSRCFIDGTCPVDEQATIAGWGWNPTKIYTHEKAKLYPARYPLNEDSVGIETVSKCIKNCKEGDQGNPEWETPTAEQAAAIALLVGILKRIYGLTNSDIFEHDIISYKTAGEGAGLYVNE